MRKPTTKRLKEAKLIISSAPGQPVSHRVEKPWRSVNTLRKERKFQGTLLALAELPAPDKLARITALAIREQLPGSAGRARLSRLEEEFLALTAALTSSSAKRLPPLVRGFLEAHGG